MKNNIKDNLRDNLRDNKTLNGIKKIKVTKVIFYAVTFLLFLWVTNPRLIPFLTPAARASIGDVWNNLFGDVDGAMEILTVNWAALFKLIAMILLLMFITTLAKFIIQHIKPKTGTGKSVITMLNSAVSWFLTLVGIFWGLSIVGVSMGTVFASVGVLALIIGFGAESLVADVVTGIFLVFERNFNVDDIIELDGFRGTVEYIGVRTTSIRDVGGNVKIINNSDIRNVLNRSDATSVAVTDVSVSYSANLEEVEAAIAEILPQIKRTYPKIFISIPEYIGVQELGSSGVVLRFIAGVREKDIFTATRIMNRELKIGFDKAKIEIPYTQVVVHQAKDN